MADTSVKKLMSASAPRGPEGQLYLASGKRVSMRMWENEAPNDDKTPRRHSYETVGYAISGKAELVLEGQTVRLEAGDSWLVPADAEHTYRILEAFTAVEATSPPAEHHGRETGGGGGEGN